MAYKKQVKQTEQTEQTEIVSLEETVEVKEIKQVKQEKKKEVEVIVHDFQLSVSEYKTFNVDSFSKVTVKNVGGGDVQVGEKDFSLENSLILYVGEEKEFSNVENLYITSTSMPFVSISLIK